MPKQLAKTAARWRQSSIRKRRTVTLFSDADTPEPWQRIVSNVR